MQYTILIITIIIQDLYNARTSIEDTEALVMPAKSVGINGP